MFSDTYADKHYIIIRRPPFDENSITDAMSSINIPEEFGGVSETTISQIQKELAEGEELVTNVTKLNTAEVDDDRFPKMLLLGEEDVLSENLSYSQKSYSWFQLSDMGNFAGQSVNLGVYPGVYIDEFAQIFGNNRFSVTSNYSNQDFWSDGKSVERLDLYAKHASELLSWIIETHLYLPFTREGTIVIAGGDRRFRAGTWFYYKPTNEIFYIKGVTNSLNMGSTIERTTVLQVERGVVREYIKGVPDDEKNPTVYYSYFSLINIKEFKEKYYEAVSKGTVLEKFDQKSILKVDKKVLDFFLKRGQVNRV